MYYGVLNQRLQQKAQKLYVLQPRLDFLMAADSVLKTQIFNLQVQIHLLHLLPQRPHHRVRSKQRLDNSSKRRDAFRYVRHTGHNAHPLNIVQCIEQEVGINLVAQHLEFPLPKLLRRMLLFQLKFVEPAQHGIIMCHQGMNLRYPHILPVHGNDSIFPRLRHTVHTFDDMLQRHESPVHPPQKSQAQYGKPGYKGENRHLGNHRQLPVQRIQLSLAHNHKGFSLLNRPENLDTPLLVQKLPLVLFQVNIIPVLVKRSQALLIRR